MFENKLGGYEEYKRDSVTVDVMIKQSNVRAVNGSKG